MNTLKRGAQILGTLLMAGLLTLQALAQQPVPAGERALELRKPVQREMPSEQVHSYSVQLTAGQVLDLVVEQKGVDLVVGVSAPDGRSLVEVDSPYGAEGPEPVLLLAQTTGTYTVKVQALEKGASGRYVITLNDRRTPTEKDRKHFEGVVKLGEVQKIENQWIALYNQGRYAEAIPLAERALAIREGVLGPDHPDLALTINSLAILYQNVGDYARAESLYRRSLSIDRSVFGEDHPNLAIAYGNLATLYFHLGDYRQSEELLKKSLALREKAFGGEHSDVALTLHNLAKLYQYKGDYAGAELLCQRAPEIYKKVLPADHPDVARSLGALAELYRVRGDFTHAEPLYHQALAIYQKLGSQADFWAATETTNLATLYQELRNYEKAEQLYLRALATYENALGKEHPDVAQVLNNLAVVYSSKGEHSRAEQLYQRALAIRKKLYGTESAVYAESLHNLAHLYWETGDYARAKPLSEQAITILEKTLGRDHPRVALAYSNLAVAQSETGGDLAGAVKTFKRVNEIEEHNLKLILTTGSEDQKRLYLDRLPGDYIVSLNVRYAPGDAEATDLALTTVLQRKGRALDAMSDQIGNLRRRASAEDSALLDRLEGVRSQLATLQISGGGKFKTEERAAEISKLEAENEQLEARIGRRSEEFRAEFQAVDVGAVRRALPAGTALVEFVLFRAFDLQAKKVTGEQYAAYVMRPESQTPLVVGLGDAPAIDEQIQRWRLALSDPKRKDVKALGRDLDEKLMRPVRKVLGPARHLFVSPDGALNMMPFAALVDEKNRYLVEDYSITYLTSGRDLLRLQFPRGGKPADVVIVADPLFDLGPELGGGSVASAPKTESADVGLQSKRSVDFTTLDYKRLPGTAAEAKALSALWASATVWTGEQSTEAALKRVQSPRILHIATHGFFLPNKSRAEKASGPLGGSTPAVPGGSPVQENPLLRSGLILAGVKQQRSGGGEDGVLTALEMASLNLSGTKLVVLSACETGLGDVKRGEGLYGLRRALVLAGSESEVISLWRVSDAGTRDLMTAYYTRLQSNQGRTEALREVQLAMLGGKLTSGAVGKSGRRETTDSGGKAVTEVYRHPYYWASFIQSGDWRSMDSK